MSGFNSVEEGKDGLGGVFAASGGDESEGPSRLAEALARLAATSQDDAGADAASGPGPESRDAGTSEARLDLYQAILASELFVLLEEEAGGGTLKPRLYPLETGLTALGFDSEAALAGFAGEAVAYAALPGRVLVPMLAEARLSLLLQSGAGDAELMDAAALAWLAGTMAGPAPEEGRGRPLRFAAPRLAAADLARLVAALERRLSGVPGLETAVLAAAEWAGGQQGHIVAISGLPEPVQPPLARAVLEALELSGIEAGRFDVAFPPEATLIEIGAAGISLRPEAFEWPERPPETPQAPGMDPARPPKLR